jgi:hypothetical protein
MARRKLNEADDDIVVQSHKVEVPLLKTTFNDPHIKQIIDHVTGGDPDKIQAIKDEVAERLKQIDCVAQISPVLYEAAADNMIETILFDKFWDRKGPPPKENKPPEGEDAAPTEEERKKGGKKDVVSDNPIEDKDVDIEEIIRRLTVSPHFVKRAPPVKTAPKFSPIIFSKLISKIKAESRSFFPLRNMIDFHVIHHPEIKLVGDGLNEKNEKRFGGIDTAAATSDGTFIFNVKFCQSLIDFAHLKQLKPKDNRYGKKYVSNGGEIPDEYEYIEFLIRHEFMHYTYSDFHYRKVIPDASNMLINWVGDFRTNHRLVQQGFTQLPMGLFSSYVNFHKQGSYQEMYNLVKNEFAKLKDKCKKELGDTLDRMGDDHSEGGSNTDGTEKAAERKLKPEDVDKWNKKVKDKQADEDDSPPPDYENKPPEDRAVGNSKGEKTPIDYTQANPRYKWDALLKKMIGETTFTLDQSYQKVSHRAIGTMQQVIKTNRGAIKPGDVKNPNKKKIKLAVIIDSSGSMSYVIHTVMANLDKLLVQRQGLTGVQDDFYLFIFSGDYDIYECSPGKHGHANNITDIDSGKPGPLGKSKLQHVLSNHKSGGTVFSSSLASQIKKLASRGYNCLVVSDGDLLWGENLTHFRDLYNSYRKHVWLLLDSKETFSKFCTTMKEISNNASHM